MFLTDTDIFRYYIFMLISVDNIGRPIISDIPNSYHCNGWAHFLSYTNLDSLIGNKKHFVNVYFPPKPTYSTFKIKM